MNKKRTTKKQLETILTFFENNGETLRVAKSSSDNAAKERKWNELRDMLNSQDGPVKTTKEWKNVFNDMKINGRRKARLLKCETTKTGGGPSKAKELSEFDERLLSILNPIVIEGMTNVPEAGATIPEEAFENILFVEDSAELPASATRIETSPVVPQTLVEQQNIEPQEKSAQKKRGMKRKMEKRSQNLDKLIESNYAMANAINNVAKAIENGFALFSEHFN